MEFSLQKDEPKKILVKYDDERRLFTMRWTLYINDMLTVLRSYDTHVAQNLLQLDHTHQSFRQNIRGLSAKNGNVAYILVKFKAFDFQKNRAKFTLLLYNTDADTILEELKSR